MFLSAVVNELMKMRSPGSLAVAAALTAGVPGVALLTASGSGMYEHLEDPGGYVWKLLLACLHTGASLAAPLLISVLAGRQVEVEHSGGGWLAHAGAGLPPGRLAQAKLVALVCVLLPVTVLWFVAVVCCGWAAGVVAPLPVARFLGYAVSLLVVMVMMLALQTALSSFLDNQLLPLGVGLCGSVLTTFGRLLPQWLQYLTPWTYFILTEPADFVGPDLVYLEHGFPSAVVLAAGGRLLFLCSTVLLDRREV